MNIKLNNSKYHGWSKIYFILFCEENFNNLYIAYSDNEKISNV